MSGELEQKRRWRLVGFGLLLLLVGMIIGAAGGVIATRTVVHRAMKNPDSARDRYVARVKQQLKLEGDQADRFDAIVAERISGLREIRLATVPAVRAEFVTLDTQMRAILTEEQVAVWNRHYARIQKLVPASAHMP